MVSIEFLIFLLIFALVIVLFLSIYFYFESKKEKKEIIERIKKIGEDIPSEEKFSFLRRIKARSLNFFSSLGTVVKPKENEFSGWKNKFLTAGYRGENIVIIFSGIKLFLAVIFAIGFFLVKITFFKTMPSNLTMFFTVLLAVIGFYLPNLWLQMKIAKRKEKIQLGLPDALDLMVVCVEAGMGLDAAINRVGEEMKLSNKDLSDEFRILNLELRAGKPRRDALRNLALRTDLEDIRSLVTMLIQTEQFGTSIGQALRVHSDAMRTKRYQRAEEIAQKIPVKLIFPLILFIFPSLLMVILGPAIIGVLRAVSTIQIGR